METGLRKRECLLAHETEMSDFELKKVVIRTPLIPVSTLPLRGVSRVLGAPLALLLTPSDPMESVSLCLAPAHLPSFDAH